MENRKRPASRALSQVSSPSGASSPTMIKSQDSSQALAPANTTDLSSATVVPSDGTGSAAFAQMQQDGSEVDQDASSRARTQPQVQGLVRPPPIEHQDRTDRKRQAQGNAVSPRPFVRRDHQTSYDWGLPTASTTSPGSVPTNPSLASQFGRPRPPVQSGNDFVMPGQPQSARHQAATHVSSNNMSPSLPPASLQSGVNQQQNVASIGVTGRDSETYTSTSSPVHHRPGSATGSHSGSGSGSAGDGMSSPHTTKTSNNSRHYGNIRPPSRFVNYSEGPSMRQQYNISVMDLDESLRALYFAPMPLVVLDNNRAIKMLNKPAEILLDVNDVSCIGQRIDRYVTTQSRSDLHIALNEASERTSGIESSIPSSTRLSIQPSGNKASRLADLTISAWHSTEQIYGTHRGSESRTTPAQSGALTDEPSSISNYSSPTSPADRSTPSSAMPTPAAPHEAYFTICILPSRARTQETSPSQQSNMLEMLKLCTFEQQETPLMAVNKDTSVCSQNPACRRLLGLLKDGELAPSAQPAQISEEKQQISEEKQAELDGDFSWIESAMTCWDENFQIPYPTSKWPIYRCAVLGQRTEPVLIGCESRATGKRLVLEIAGLPLRDNGGFGEHIGGMITLKDVTGQKAKMREEVREEGDVYFKQTCDAMPQLVWVTSATGYHEWYSKSWYEYTGSTHEQCRGVGWQTFFHEEDLPEAGKRWSYSLRTGELYETAYRCRRFDGQWRWFLGRALPMRDPVTGVIGRWFGTCTDIHDQVETLAASRQAQLQLENVIYHAAMTLWAVDKDGRITVAEGPGIRMSKTPSTPADLGDGLRPMEDGSEAVLHPHPPSRTASHSTGTGSGQRTGMVGRSIYSIWDQPLVKTSIEKALRGETSVEEMEIDGKWYRTSFTPMRSSSNEAGRLLGAEPDKESEGEIIGVVGTSMDITEKKLTQERMEESLLEKTRALAAEGAAREASRLKSEFLANMSHEIRTPIAGVIGLSELLLDEKGLSPQQRDYAETIQRSAEGLLTVINDVLDFSKVEIGKLDVEKAPYNLEVLIRDAKRMLGFATQKKGLDFREAVRLNYKGQVMGDVGRLRQVLTNLLTNAIKFTASGYISLEVTELQQDSKTISVKFDVRDTGCGVKKETLSRLFQPFSQADPSTARRFGGTGLGLSISKNLVELMHGTIGLESVEGEGSHAWFTIPFDKAISTPEEPIGGSSANSTSPMPSAFGGQTESIFMGRPRKDIWILIAEDNVINAQIASKNIKRMGFSCRTAENGIKALEELGKHSYDAVLMDCQMPECDGYEATRMIRKSLNPDIRMLPVIALTASAIKGDRERAIDAGMVDYLAKPVKRVALEAALCKWLYDQDARQSLAKYMAVSQESVINVEERGTKWSGVIPAMQDNSATTQNPPLPTAALTGSGKNGIHSTLSEYPFYSNAAATPAPGHDPFTPSTHDRFAAVRLSPSSESVMERLRQPEGALNQETLGHFNRGDALGAAAVLLTARRSSVDSVVIGKSPSEWTTAAAHSTRSLSQDAKMANAGVGAGGRDGKAEAQIQEEVAQALSATPMGEQDGVTTSRRWAAIPHRASLLRQSSRDHGGVGRDLEGEVFRATLPREPGLDALLDSPDDDTPMAERITAREK